MTQLELQEFFKDRPAINLTALAKECGISSAYLHYIVQGKRRLTKKKGEKIAKVLKKYGGQSK